MAPRAHRLLAAAAAPLLLLRAADARVCLPPPADAICLSWVTDADNITLTGTWPALNTGGPSPVPVGWGGWGISSVSCGSMYPASIWFISSGPSGLVLEDRATNSHQPPQCRKQQLSHVTSSSKKPDGSFTVTWTRPLVAPPSSGQPTIVPGNNVSLIGAAYAGYPLDLRPCEYIGIPGHVSVGTFTVKFLAGEAAAGAAAGEGAGALARLGAPAPPAPTGLIASVPVCANAYSSLVRVSPSGAVSYYGVAAPVLPLLGYTAFDPAGRRLYAITFNAAGTAFELSSIDIDTGRVAAPPCPTGVLVPPNSPLENIGLAWDALNASVIVAACTDAFCAGYVQVTRILPGSCKLVPVVKVPTDPAAEQLPGAAAFDAASNTFVTSLTQTVRGSTGLVLVAVDMATGAVAHVFNEAGSNVDVVALVAEGGASPPGTFVGLTSTNAFVRYDAVANKLTRAPPLTGVGVLPGSGVLDPGSGGADSDAVLYFLSPDSRVVGVYTANGTLASSAALPGDTGQTPVAFLFAPSP